MKNFKCNSSKTVLILFILLVLTTGCDKISQGSQRKKFEFLYKINNYATLFREYTGGINSYNDLDFYINRMNKLYEDVSKMQTIDGYGISRILKDKLLSTIDLNINTATTIKQTRIASNESIRTEYDIIMMQERVDKFINELNDEISVVGKE